MSRSSTSEAPRAHLFVPRTCYFSKERSDWCRRPKRFEPGSNQRSSDKPSPSLANSDSRRPRRSGCSTARCADSHQSSRRFSINVATDSHQSSHPILSMVATPERSDAITLLSAVLLSRFPRQRYHRRRPCCKVEGHGVRAARAPHESERRARTMLSHHPSRFSDAPERSDDSTARSAAPCRDHALVPAPASSLRMDLPRSSMRMAPWTRRSRMASARVASLSCRCQSATGN